MKKNIKFLLLVGISGSGKSTFAKRIFKKRPNNTLIVNRDSIRNMLFGYTEETAYLHYNLPKEEFYRREKQVSNISNMMIRDAILGKNEIDTIVLDNTHLKMKYIREYEYYNIPIEIKIFDIDLDTAINRDKNRARKVGEDVIKRQYEQFKTLLKKLENYQYTPKQIPKYDNSKRDAIVIDLDGTLAHATDRDIFDYSKVETDKLDDVVAELVVNSGFELIICSGRESKALDSTKKWLKSNMIFYRKMYMRETGDYRKDWKVKEEFWDEISKEYNIVGMIDDRSQVVDRARYLGYKVLQVDYGNF